MRVRSALKLLVVIGLTLEICAPARAWFCEEGSSKREDQDIYACGIGTDADEGVARNKAFDAAQAEFGKICENSSDCKGKKTRIEPMRTSCEAKGGVYKCYRMLLFRVFDPKQAGEQQLQAEVKSKTFESPQKDGLPIAWLKGNGGTTWDKWCSEQGFLRAVVPTIEKGPGANPCCGNKALSRSFTVWNCKMDCDSATIKSLTCTDLPRPLFESKGGPSSINSHRNRR